MHTQIVEPRIFRIPQLPLFQQRAVTVFDGLPDPFIHASREEMVKPHRCCLCTVWSSGSSGLLESLLPRKRSYR
jgi:hypothetical protein